MLLDHFRSELAEIESKEKALASRKEKVLQKLFEYAFLEDSSQVEQKLRDLCSTDYLIQYGCGSCYFIHILNKVIFENGTATFIAEEIALEKNSLSPRGLGDREEFLSREIYDPNNNNTWRSITKEEYTHLLSEAQEVANKLKMFSEYLK